MDHNTIKEIPLAAINEDEKLFTTKLEDLPNNTFKLAVSHCLDAKILALDFETNFGEKAMLRVSLGT